MCEIISFFGGDTQVGTTMISQSVASSLGKKKKRVLLMLCSGNYGNDYLDNNTDYSIDDIKANLLSNNICKEDIDGILVRQDEYKILPGVKDITRVKYYREDDVGKITSVIKNDYDYIIIDAGSNVNYGINISALLEADKIFFIITQNEKTIKRFINTYYKVLNPLRIKGKIINNKYRDEFGGNIFELKEILGKGNFINVNYSEEGFYAEIKHTTLLNDNKFRNGINEIIRDITGEVKVKNKFFIFNR
jgi:MinD-like ATPase involved in chromosome partitioning or flagellar assembly